MAQIYSDPNVEWHSAAQRYLARLGLAEYSAGLAAHVKRGRKRATYRHTPSEYHFSLVVLLGRNDEAGFKALKGEQGYASKVGS